MAKKEESKKLGKLINIVLLGLAVVPVVWLLGVLSYAIRASWYLGWWPVLYHPDPKMLSFEGHYVVVFLGIYILKASLALLPSIRLCSLEIVSNQWWQRAKWTYFSGWGLILVFCLVPKINFVAWFLD